MTDHITRTTSEPLNYTTWPHTRIAPPSSTDRRSTSQDMNCHGKL
jgi:hypothetical protein